MAGPIYFTKTLYQKSKILNYYYRHVHPTLQNWISSGPTQVFQEKIKSGVLNQDDYQLKVVKHLQFVYDDIVSYTPKSNLAKFFFKSQTPKGLYVYGSVGGGKTMLMDLFYETCEV